jgi:hypothetical protein
VPGGALPQRRENLTLANDGLGVEMFTKANSMLQRPLSGARSIPLDSFGFLRGALHAAWQGSKYRNPQELLSPPMLSRAASGWTLRPGVIPKLTLLDSLRGRRGPARERVRLG